MNLEKALRAHDRLGGHLVSGHVDGLGVVSKFEPVGDGSVVEGYLNGVERATVWLDGLDGPAGAE